MIIKDILMLLQTILNEGRAIQNTSYIDKDMSEETRISLRKELTEDIKSIEAEAANVIEDIKKEFKIYGVTLNKSSGFSFAGRGNALIKKINELIEKYKDNKKIINILEKIKQLKIDLIEKSKKYVDLGFYNTPPSAIYGDLSPYYPENPAEQPILFCGNCGQPIKISRHENKKIYSDLYGRLMQNGGLPWCAKNTGCQALNRNTFALHNAKCEICGNTFMQEKHKNKKLCPECARKETARVSQAELYVREFLESEFKNSDIEFTYSDRKTLYEEGDRKGNSVELDILIKNPKAEWMAAVEINGAHHYQEIRTHRGKDRKATLEAIQKRDAEKKERCKKRNIDLLILNIGNANFSKKLGNKVLGEIIDFINRKQNGTSIPFEEKII
jgi:predicted RNA-binding Zn-ribbon protein involved in translation (DUF1610 family)